MREILALIRVLLKKVVACFQPRNAMTLRDVMQSTQNDPNWDRRRQDEEREQQRLRQELEALKERIQYSPASVPDFEILEGVRKQFNLTLSSDFLEEAPWLMEALSFTRMAISPDRIHEAWGKFQDEMERFSGFVLDEFQILEGIAEWYFHHKDDATRIESEMIARALAVYEQLLLLVRGREAESDFEGLLSGIGLTVYFSYCGLGNFERAKFYFHLLESEFKNGRLSEEDYLKVLNFYGQILVRERGSSLTSTEEDRRDPCFSSSLI
ncbi:MAG: hypothetical protein EXR96_09135 [Nitrospiraceae bacterium]|nr:hypothetical protein [Nitrospiraceae bacterium]